MGLYLKFMVDTSKMECIFDVTTPEAERAKQLVAYLGVVAVLYSSTSLFLVNQQKHITDLVGLG